MRSDTGKLFRLMEQVPGRLNPWAAVLLKNLLSHVLRCLGFAESHAQTPCTSLEISFAGCAQGMEYQPGIFETDEESEGCEGGESSDSMRSKHSMLCGRRSILKARSKSVINYKAEAVDV